jgi:hypothetical protein
MAAAALARSSRTHRNPRERRRIGYPPLDTPKPIGEGIWIVDSGPLRAMGMPLPVRMTIIRLGSGELLLHSPVQFTAALAEEVKALGRVAHLIAPSIGHWTFLAEWQRAFPAARTWGVPGLRDRRQVRNAGVRIDRDLEGLAPGDWSGELEQGLVAGGAGFTEAYFFHAQSRTLVLTDLVENLEPDKLPPVTAALARIVRATGGKTPIHVRLAVRAGGESARTAIRAMLALAPERVVFAHGRWFEGRGSERLQRAFEWLV